MKRLLTFMIPCALLTCHYWHVSNAQGVAGDHLVSTRTVLLPEKSTPTDVQPIDSVLVVACPGTKSLIVLDRSNYSVIKSVSISERPVSIVLDNQGKYLYVSCAEDAKVRVLDSKTLLISRTIELPAGTRPSEIQLTGDGKTAIIGDRANPYLYVIDLPQGLIRKRISVSLPVFRVILDEISNRIYVASTEAGFPEVENSTLDRRSKIDFIDFNSYKIFHTLILPERSFVGLCVGPKDEIFVVSRGFLRRVSTMPTNMGKILDETKISGRGLDVVYDSHLNSIYVSAGRLLSFVDYTGLKVVKSTAAGSGLIYLSRSGNASNLYIASEATNTLLDVLLTHPSSKGIAK